uniref:Ig-like domain-containing protein n=1 Tax=Glossina brevipalpis TaxID=37001 RepID=A0A1A9WIC2_9MUSC
MTSSDGNTTVSELVLIPVPEDNERQVVCSISLNPAMSSQHLPEGHTTVTTVMGNGNTGLYLKDSRMLNVTHAPIVSLSLGAPLNPNNLLKGSDVYLECEVKANPGITKVEWYHNDKQLHSSRGIIISNQTLVLQGISKGSHGQYFCRATNIQGSVSSNEVYLDVKYPPVCKSDSTIIRAAVKQTINITCQVDSNPLDYLNYKWHFNNSLENLIELPYNGGSNSASNPQEQHQQMLLQHTDANHASAGYYQRNKRKHSHAQQQQLPKLVHHSAHHTRHASSPMGHSQPCWYHIQPAAYNATANSLQIQCVAGFDGGIPQHFHVQIYDETNRQILYNISYRNPEFTIKRLPSDSLFIIRITAVNGQGPSKLTYKLRARTLMAPLLRTGEYTHTIHTSAMQ